MDLLDRVDFVVKVVQIDFLQIKIEKKLIKKYKSEEESKN